MTNRIQVGPSILAADFAAMGAAVEGLTAWGADYVHVDVMDGCYVPNITFGPDMVRAIRRHTSLPLDVHLMVDRPGDWVGAMADAGADIITFHVEAERHIHSLLQRIHAAGCKAGVVLNPTTPVCMAEHALPFCEVVLVMTVNPGFGGQSFIPETVGKVAALARMRDELGLAFDLEVDGGVNAENVASCRQAGASMIVAGSSVFNAPDPAAMVRLLRG